MLSTDTQGSKNVHVFSINETSLKGCDSNFEEKCSNFKSCYKWHNYIALNNMYQDSA